MSWSAPQISGISKDSDVTLSRFNRMSANLEKSSRIRGIVVSALLHGIFIAGCLALDAGNLAKPSADAPNQVHIQSVETPPGHLASKS